MKHSRIFVSVAALAIVTCCPAGSAQSLAEQRNPSTAVAPPGPVAPGTNLLAKMLRAKVDVSWLFEPVLLKHVVPSPDDETMAVKAQALARVAVARGLAARPDVSTALAAADALVLAEAARRSLIDSIVVSDSDVAARIAQHPGRYDEYQLSHIFIAVGPIPGGKMRSEAEALARAKQLRARIVAGERFAKVAEAASDDRETAGQGGTLSTLLGVTMNPAFFSYVRALPAEGISAPVRGPAGYHVIRLQDRRPASVSSARFWVEQDIIGERLPQLIARAVADTSGQQARASPLQSKSRE